MKNFDSEKLAHKICTKIARNFSKLAKMPKIAQKRQIKMNEKREKTKN